MDRPTPTAVYCRVSTEKDDQLNSLENQRRYFLDYIEKSARLSLYKIYADSGISGTAAKNRKAFMEMLEDAKKGRFRALITKEVSRFSRNILDAIAYTRELKKLGVRVIFLNDGIDTFQPDSELRLSIMAGFAQEESRKISDRVKWGQSRSMESGVVFGSSMLGYTVSEGKIKIEPKGAKIVREIYGNYLFGRLSAVKIASLLENQGVRTFKNGKVWSPSVIMKILKNEKYCGDLRQKKTYTPDYLTHEKKQNHGEEDFICIKSHHQPIIPRKIWEEVQQEIKNRARKPFGLICGNTESCESSEISEISENCKNWENYENCPISHGRGIKYPLSGKIFCGVCGSPFVCRKRYCGSKTISVWKCSSALKGKNHCGFGKQLREDHCMHIFRHCADLLFSSGKLNKKELICKTITLICRSKNAGEEENKKRTAEAEKAVKLINRKRLSLFELYLSEGISLYDMEAIKKKYDRELEDEENLLKRLKNSQNSFPKDLEKSLETAIENELSKGTALCGCVEKLTFFPGGTVRLKFKALPEIYEFSIALKAP